MPPPKALRKTLLGHALAALFFFFIAAYAIHWLITGRPSFFRSGTGSPSPANGGGETVEFDDPTLLSWSADPARVDAGRDRYLILCSACHAEDLTAIQDGEPLPALSLIDGDWKYGSRPGEIFALIRDGTPRDAPGHNGLKMLPWGETLNSAEIAELVAYLLAENSVGHPRGSK